MAKRYYWLKLKADWFSDKRIKKLRSIAGGDTHTIIYLKMMLLSLKDERKLYFEGVEDNFASEIALALDEDAENVKLTNFATILNSLFYGSENRNEYIVRLCSYPLLILDDFGMERGTEYGLEQVYNVIDSRYISKKPLIATTNLTPEQLRNPEDVPHARIYGRLLEMCVPVRFTGGDFRRITAQQKMERLKKLME